MLVMLYRLNSEILNYFNTVKVDEFKDRLLCFKYVTRKFSIVQIIIVSITWMCINKSHDCNHRLDMNLLYRVDF